MFAIFRKECCYATLAICLAARLAIPQQETPVSSAEHLREIVASIDDPATAIALLKTLPSDLTPAELVQLQHLDRNLPPARTESERQLAREVLLALGSSNELSALEYIHQVFETMPTRRQDAARAIAEFAIRQRRRAADWRLLVRALPVVDNEDARVVLQALQMFPHRGTKPQWQREVILAGLRSGDAARIEAVKLLRHWVGQTLSSSDVAVASLSQWQAWFDEQHPELPPPTLPVDPPTARYKYAELLALLNRDNEPRGDPDRGAVVFEKALCSKCHRFGPRGEAMGPDLTNARQWLQVKQLLEATVFPSQSITDQYETTTILTTSGQTFSGVLAADNGKIVVLQANGMKEFVDRNDIEEAIPNRKSAMPDGLLDSLSLEEIADLFAYLQQTP